MTNSEKLKQTVLDVVKKLDADINKHDLNALIEAIDTRFELKERAPREYWICPRCLTLLLHKPNFGCTCGNLNSINHILLREVR